MQQFWLRQQNDLVRKSKAGEEQAHSIDSLKKQLLILDQKKLRTDGEELLRYIRVGLSHPKTLPSDDIHV